jgi:hypothetical protein
MLRSGFFFVFCFPKQNKKKGYMPVPILPDFIFIIIRVVVKRAVLMKLKIVGRSVGSLTGVR